MYQHEYFPALLPCANFYIKYKCWLYVKAQRKSLSIENSFFFLGKKTQDTSAPSNYYRKILPQGDAIGVAGVTPTSRTKRMILINPSQLNGMYMTPGFESPVGSSHALRSIQQVFPEDVCVCVTDWLGVTLFEIIHWQIPSLSNPNQQVPSLRISQKHRPGPPSLWSSDLFGLWEVQSQVQLSVQGMVHVLYKVKFGKSFSNFLGCRAALGTVGVSSCRVKLISSFHPLRREGGECNRRPVVSTGK